MRAIARILTREGRTANAPVTNGVPAARPTALRILALTLLLASQEVRGYEIPVPAIVRFNTVCTNCHEGECSGRLTFSSGAEAAREHMQRYLGSVTAPEAESLFDLLRYTKEHCAHYPVPAAVHAGGIWSAADLSAWRNSREGGYFVPLGALQAGRYRLHLSLSGSSQGRLKITDERFEPVLDEAFCPGNTQEVVFPSPGGPLYLTLHTAAELTGIRLAPVPRQRRTPDP
jgi:hypothetical protein